MNNTIQEVSVDLHDWRDEQEAWNNRSKFFVELHNRADRKAQVAREGYKTTGIDLSDGMIHGAKQLADTEGLDVSLYIAPWSEETRQKLGWDKSFDLAYSIFCPIMFDVENIRAMHDASHDTCLWIAFRERMYKTVPETEVMSLDKAVDYFTMRLHNNEWGTMEDMKREIRQLIEPRAIDGKIHNKTVDTVAWVSWSVK